MSEIPVRCDSCGEFSRVPAYAAGKMAICPGCRTEFVIRAPAVVESAPVIPTVYPAARGEDTSGGLLIGLAISAFLVPLAWLLLKSLGARPPVFTYGLPLAIAFAAAGLGIGIALARDWSVSTRLRAIFTLLLLAWGSAATFYFLKPEWVEEIRRELGLPLGPWQEFRAPSKAYRIYMPGRPRPEKMEIITGWALDIYSYADRDKKTFAFCVGEGKPDAAKRGQNDDQFFEAAKAGALEAANGTLVNEKSLVLQGQKGREYSIKLADQATNRTLRVYRNGTEKVVVAMVEGAFLPPDAKEVRKFFDSLDLKTGR